MGGISQFPVIQKTRIQQREKQNSETWCFLRISGDEEHIFIPLFITLVKLSPNSYHPTVTVSP